MGSEMCIRDRYNTDTGEVKVIPNQSEHMGGFGLPAEIISNLGASVLICRGAGRRAIQIFSMKGIKVYFGADGKVSEALKAWKENRLPLATEADACQEHAFRDYGRHHHHHW